MAISRSTFLAATARAARFLLVVGLILNNPSFVFSSESIDITIAPNETVKVPVRNLSRHVMTNPGPVRLEAVSVDTLLIKAVAIGETVVHLWDDGGLRSYRITVSRYGTRSDNNSSEKNRQYFDYEISNRARYQRYQDTQNDYRESETLHRMHAGGQDRYSNWGANFEYASSVSQNSYAPEGLRLANVSMNRGPWTVVAGDSDVPATQSLLLGDASFQGGSLGYQSKQAHTMLQMGATNDHFWGTSSRALAPHSEFAAMGTAMNLGRSETHIQIAHARAAQQIETLGESRTEANSGVGMGGFTPIGPIGLRAEMAATSASADVAYRLGADYAKGAFFARAGFEDMGAGYRSVLNPQLLEGHQSIDAGFSYQRNSSQRLGVEASQLQQQTFSQGVVRSLRLYGDHDDGLKKRWSLNQSVRTSPLTTRRFTAANFDIASQRAENREIGASLRGVIENNPEMKRRQEFAVTPSVFASFPLSRMLTAYISTGLSHRASSSAHWNPVYRSSLDWRINRGGGVTSTGVSAGGERRLIIDDEYVHQAFLGMNLERALGGGMAAFLNFSGNYLISATNPSAKTQATVEMGARFSPQLRNRRETISGVVFIDTNMDGTRQPSEALITTAKIEVQPEGKTINVDGQGRFRVRRDLQQKISLVVLSESIPTGYVPTTTMPAVMEADISGADFISFGFAPRRQVKLVVFLDKNGDGVFGDGDVRSGNTRVESNNSGSGFTNRRGEVVFQKLPLGPLEFWISGSELPTGYMSTLRVVEQNVEDGTDVTIYFPLIRSRKIQGRVFWDRNRNHHFDAGEEPVQDAEVRVKDVWSLTDGAGRYEIKPVSQGKQTLEVRSESWVHHVSFSMPEDSDVINVDFPLDPKL